MIAIPRLLEVFVEAADILVDEYDVVEFLHRLADNVSEVSGADAVGLLLGDHLDRLHFMAASTTGARHVELFQVQNDEGPCLDCFRTGVPVIVEDLSGAAGRWPAFAPRAETEGFRSVHAFPMRLRHRVIGALNVFSESVLPLQAEEVRAVQALADVATIAIIQQQSRAAAEALTEQLRGALDSRIVIEQAKGAVARSAGVDVDQAFSMIRAYARRHGIRLGDLAHSLVTREFDPRRLGAPAGDDT